MKRALLLLVVCLAGCDDFEQSMQPPPPHEHELAPKQYVCTVEEMARVEKESLFCDENTSFYSSYCYGTAIIRNCTKKE